MAEVIPFRGVRYDSSQVSDISRVIAPPYDVIDTETQRGLHDRHPCNVIRLELGLDQPGDDGARNRYTRAAHLLREWLQSGVLRRDPRPAVYFYTIDYELPDYQTGVRRLRGFLTTVALAEFGTGQIYPHENTRSAAKMDRLRLLEACHANFSPIFSLCSDPGSGILELLEKSVDADRPAVDFVDDVGFRQRLWPVTDARVLREVVGAMGGKPLFIADGHHRYETALNYQRLRRAQAGDPGDRQPYDSVLMLISTLEDPGLTVLPTHRVLRVPLPSVEDIVRQLGDSFQVERIRITGEERTARARFLATVREGGRRGQVFGLALRGADAFLVLTLTDQGRTQVGSTARDRLDVSVLHQLVVPRLTSAALDEQTLLYTKDEQEALDWVDGGSADAALLLNPTKVEEVRAVAEAGDRMPHKSTYFFPKPLTGLVMNVLEE